MRRSRSGASILVLSFILMMFGASGCGDDGAGPSSDPPGFTNADGLNGGQLYDEFWEDETGWNQNDPNIATFGAFADFFRCKQCHGWDLLGNRGAYISRGPRTTRPNVTAHDLRQVAATKSAQQLFDAIKASAGRRAITADLSTYDPNTNATVGDMMPDYGSFMTDAQIWDLVRFLKVEAIDTSLLYDSQTSGTYPSGSITFTNIGKDGDAAAGNALYATKCAACHGADGRLISVDGGFSVGSHVRAKPNEDHHKIKFGQLGTAMASQTTSTTEIKNLFKALANATNYPDPTP